MCLTHRIQSVASDAEAAYLRDARYAEDSAVTDAVGLAPSLLPRPGAVAITVTTTALDPR